ncbi:MAG: hypothetical protein LUC85_09775 [Bacteroidales bacterium]|nr:hypothetical protein [Bacteroidales bacterium]MCD8395102.1 hypothetical protein [Bacteroidales bacterium]
MTHLDSQFPQLMAFLAKSYSGGNDEDLLFNFLFEQLTKSPKYKSIMKAFKGADLLVVSDFEWRPLSVEATQSLETAKGSGMRIFSLVVDSYGRWSGRGEYISLNDIIFDPDTVRKNGRWFVDQSDHRFIYHDGRLTALQPIPNPK